MMSANLRAFLFLVRWCEGTSDENGYRALYGHLKDKPKLFNSFDDHPRTFFDTPWGRTSAAGAYQFLSGTWDDAKDALGLTDFSPESQDSAAVWLIKRRGALHAVEQGDLDNAIHLCNKEWASLPGSPYGQPTRTLESCRVIFERAGGTLMRASVESSNLEAASSATGVPKPPTSAPVPTPIKEGRMSAALTALGIELLKLVPWVQKHQQQVDKVVPKLLEVAKEVHPQGNEQARVEAIQSDPALRERFVAQVAVRWNDIAPFLEYEAKERRESREFVEQMTGSGPLFRQIAFGLMVATLAFGIVFGGAWMLREIYMMQSTTDETRGNIVGFLLAMIPVVVYWVFGSSRSSQIKDQALINRANLTER